MLLRKFEAQSHNSDICDSDTDRSVTSDNEYVPSEHSDQEECVHVCRLQMKLILMAIT